MTSITKRSGSQRAIAHAMARVSPEVRAERQAMMATIEAARQEAGERDRLARAQPYATAVSIIEGLGRGEFIRLTRLVAGLDARELVAALRTRAAELESIVQEPAPAAPKRPAKAKA